MKILLYLSAILMGASLSLRAQENGQPYAATPLQVDADMLLEVQARYVFRFEGTASGDKWLAKKLRDHPSPRLRAIDAENRMTASPSADTEAYAAALETIRQLTLEGDAYAKVVLAREYLNTARKLPADERMFRYMDVVRLLQPLRELEYPGVYEPLSYMYLWGYGVPQEEATAWRLSQAALWHGRPAAAAMMADYWLKNSPASSLNYEQGLNALYAATRENSHSAWRKLEELVAKGDPAAIRIHALAKLWRYSLGADYTTPEIKKAVVIAEQLAPSDAEAAYILAIQGYSRGAGSKAAKTAYAWAQKAAELGNENGFVMMAWMQAEGHGTEKQPATAIETLQTYAAKNNPRALGLLGYYSYWGELHKHGMKKDMDATYRYCSQAAAMGDITSVINTALCFEQGIGVSKDYRRALFYRDWAARRGDMRSRDLIPRLAAAVR